MDTHDIHASCLRIHDVPGSETSALRGRSRRYGPASRESSGAQRPKPCSGGHHRTVSALTEEEGGLALTVLDSIPRSIPIHQDNPDLLHIRHVLVQTDYEEVVVDSNGFAAAGSSTVAERFQPLRVSMVNRARTPDDNGELAELTYQIDGIQLDLPLSEVQSRVGAGDLLDNPIRIQELSAQATTTVLDGTLASMCLVPQRIRRAETVITDVQLSTALDLRISEAVMLQDAGVLHLEGLQLIHPSNANPYYRSPPNQSTDDNFENLPEF